MYGNNEPLQISLDKAILSVRNSLSTNDIIHSDIVIQRKRIDGVINHMVYDIHMTVLKQSVEITPLSWWQHFKKDCFPKWALKKWPVKYEKNELFIKRRPNMNEHGPVVISSPFIESNPTEKELTC